MRQLGFQAAAIAGGVLLAMVVTEAALRVLFPDSNIRAAHRQNMSREALALFAEDPEAGYLITPGRAGYGPEGCLRNDYDVSRRKGTRLLFIGDSVTHRGKIIDALRKIYGDDAYEYWNAGVEGFNTRQEVILYRRHNAVIRPDHVLLSFHPNDFNATPVVLYEHGEMRVFQQGPGVNPWLFKHSYLYRWAWPRSEQRDRTARARIVRESLRELAGLVDRQGARFSVILIPILKPRAQWAEEEQWARQTALTTFAELGLRVFDPIAALDEALAAGVVPGETPSDSWHPGAAMAGRLAQALARDRLLEVNDSR